MVTKASAKKIWVDKAEYEAMLDLLNSTQEALQGKVKYFDSPEALIADLEKNDCRENESIQKKV